MFWRRLLFVMLVGGMFITQPVVEASAATPCNWAQFVTDVSVPDGTLVAPGAVFTKIWRIKNIGTCTWTSSYSLVFDSGSQMSGASPINLTKSVAPGQTIDLAVILAAPSVPGHYRGFWKLSDPAGATFGIGTTASGAIWVDVEVQDISTVAYDLVAFAPYAAWKSGAGALPFPGTSGDFRGYAQRLDSLTMEDGAFTTTPSLVTVPQNRYDGYIQAEYPQFAVQKGDRFQAVVGCEGGSSCYVTYRLDYVNASGVARSFWTRKEMNDGRVYQVNIDLSALAGQIVRFRLVLLATGSPEHDRAIWGAPRITRTNPAIPVTPVVPPVLTPTATPFDSPPEIIPSACDKASFVYDVTVPDGTYFAPGAAFSKTWRLKNSGTCTWTTSYRAIFYSGEQMGAPTSVNLPASVSPGQTVDLTINMLAPQAAGLHRGNWVLSNPQGVLFGTGSPAVNPFWLQINVSGDTLAGGGYDFVTNMCAAQWRNGSGALPCPGTDGDVNGFMIVQDAPHLEDGTFATLPGLLVAPQFKYGGYIQGTYPAFTVRAGDRFQAMVGCEYKAPCYATFRLDYMNAAGTVKNFWSWTEKNDSRFYNANVDLSPLAGQSVRLILVLSAAGYPNGDRVVWGAPHIQPAAVNLPATSTPTPSPTIAPPGDDWLTYSDPKYGFQFKYPAQSQIVDQSDNYVKIDLPIVPGTNLHEKYLEVSTTEDLTACTARDTNFPGQTFETVIINGLSFLKETGWEGGMNKLYEWVIYSTARGTVCARFNFLMRSVNLGVFDTPPPAFDKAAESLVFLQIMNTFVWLTPPETPSPTITPPGDGWLTYSNARYGFQFKYPPEAQIADQMDNYVKLNMPFVPGTNLMQKTLEVLVTENASTCQAPLQTNQPPETVTINGISFLKQTGSEGAAGNHYQWVAYSTARDADCVSFTLLMHSLSPGAMQTPLPEFDLAAESAVIDQVVNTFAWTALTETPTPTASATLPPMEDWLTGEADHIRFKYPSQAQIVEQSTTHLKIQLPILPGTNLNEKYLDVLISENLDPCHSTLSGPAETSETITINGLPFLKETGGDGAAGSLYEWTAYSMARAGVCASFTFVLHSNNPGAFPTPPPVFDKAAESVVFEQIMGTFLWLIPPPPTFTPVVPTFTPTETQTASADWLLWTNAHYAFQFRYPVQTEISGQMDNYVKMVLPITPGTNLLEKYVQVYVAENVATCRSPLGDSRPPQVTETVVINGVTFLKETGMEGVTGQTYQWKDYSTARAGTCVTFNFVLHSRNPGNYPTPPVIFDEAAESAVFEQMLAVFAWLAPTDTPTPIPSATDTPVEPPTATPTPSPIAGDWLTYNNPKYGFDLHYPPQSQILGQLESYVKIGLPMAPGTNLVEKHLQVYVAENVTPCRSPLGFMLPVESSTNVAFNGISFLKESGSLSVAGQAYKWISYSSSRGTTCASLNFILHSSDLTNFPTPPAAFDEAAESAVFDQIVPTFHWQAAPITPVPSDTPTLIPSDTPTVIPSDTPTGVPSGVSLPDLRINLLRYELEHTACLLPDHPFGVRVGVINSGNAAAPAFSVRVGDLEQSVPGLAIGEQAVIFFQVSAPTSGTVGAVVDPGSLVPESDETNNSQTAIVMTLTPPVPCTPTLPPGMIGPYGVVLTGQDVLPIRSGPGLSYLSVGSFLPDVNNILRTGPMQSADGIDWAEIDQPDGGNGWVDFSHLTEAKTYQQFCGDDRVRTLIGQIKQAVNTSDGSLFASLVSPKHGVRLNFWRGTPVIYNSSTAQNIFTDPSVVDWGASASGTPDIGTFVQVVQPDLAGILNSDYQLICDNPSYASMFPNAWPYTNINYFSVLKPPTDAVFDWKVWMLGFEYVDGQPYLFGTIHYVWEP